MSPGKATRQLLKQLPGWKASQTRRHIRLVHEKTGAVVTASKTPSDVRGIKNTIADCRRAERNYG